MAPNLVNNHDNNNCYYNTTNCKYLLSTYSVRSPMLSALYALMHVVTLSNLPQKKSPRMNLIGEKALISVGGNGESCREKQTHFTLLTPHLLRSKCVLVHTAAEVAQFALDLMR